MYLKALDIQGFKSFPDKTHLSFTGDITAIVGPNGSGKSNISDAIRWVLGEQSAKSLRGGKMEDVIFGGTEKRPPLGFAEVSLTIDNADGRFPCEFSEVTVTRRYYRSGESEFYINRRAARLKDIHEFFMDTGLGRDGYSSIGQGRIDEILSLKSDDRRDFFEEAAGISKFRYRKEETERKLDAAEQNLVRLRDILSELDSRVGPLRDQAEKAKIYLELSGRLRGLEITCMLDSMEKLRAALAKNSADMNAARLQLDGARSELEGLYAEAEAASEQMRQTDVELDRLRAELSSSERRTAQARADISALDAKEASIRENIARLTQELCEHGGRQDRLTERIRQGRAEIAELECRRQQLCGQTDLLSDRAGQNSELEEQLLRQARQLTDRRERLSAALTELKAEISAIDSARAEITQSLSAAENEFSERRARLDSELERAERSKLRLEQCRQKRAELENMKDGIELKAAAKAKKAEQLQSKYSELERECAALSDRIALLCEMQRDYEGFSFAVKRVMREAERGSLKNICGTVAESISVPAEYAVAIETAFGGALSNIITRTEDDAKAAISFLKSANGGRATFLPLSSVRGALMNQPGLDSEPGFVGIAASLCKYSAEYSQVIAALIGRTAVADNIDNAVRIARKFGYKFKIVTIDGQIVNAGGSMTGGSMSKNSGILSRAAELEAKRAELADRQRLFDQTERDLRQARQASAQAAADIADIDSELRLADNETVRLCAEAEQHSLLVENLKAHFDSLCQSRSQSEARLQSAADRRSKAEAELTDLQSDAERLDAALSELDAQRQNARADSESIRSELAQQNAVLCSQDARLTSLRDSVRELELLSEQSEGDELHKKELVGQYNEQLLSIGEQKERLILCANRSEADARSISENIKRQSDERFEAERRQVRANDSCREKNEQIIDLERECSRLSAKDEQLGDQQKRISDKMWDSYELTEITARAERLEGADPAECAGQIAGIKSKIKSLGAVNPAAIEEYSLVSERYEFMSAQCADLEKSKAELIGILRDLSNNMERIFAEQFAVINSNFGSTFTEIFGGGSAELVLTDPSDVLGCGIDIRVALPGKSVKAISLLSGGEKAFVAIALYFAVLKVRPSPFCILDEIEAALDDVNVDRFAAYMRKLCGSTQFIVITHRRGTMEQSDMLYGVTMQERGVSKLLALSIAEAEKRFDLSAG